MVNGERYYVAYEGLTNICSGCGMYGHLIHICSQRVHEESRAMPSNNAEVPKKNGVEIYKGGVHDEDGFTTVRRSASRMAALVKN